jgi:hypothetical protein
LSNRSPDASQELAACFIEYPRFKLHSPGCGTHAPPAWSGAATAAIVAKRSTVRVVE